MLKSIIAVGLTLSLTGCVGMVAEQQAKQQSRYDELSKCEPIKADLTDAKPSKDLLVSRLISSASVAYSDAFIADTKIKTLQLVGWNEKVSNDIITCRVDNRKARIDSIKPIFESVKMQTKDKDEKKALVEAYSSWEAYQTSLTSAAKQDFDTKISYYKNM
ncbi:hypothetical protein [Kluyvera ascorbata]|uniref:hypothetical protein n=1 Tax=Kluyvera ascorbata TaxID=51288 RepID=UPI0022E18E28|nr:hypothetical protein [Kluyvera ascorbata]